MQALAMARNRGGDQKRRMNDQNREVVAKRRQCRCAEQEKKAVEKLANVIRESGIQKKRS